MDARIIAVLVGFVLGLIHSAPKLQSIHKHIKTNIHQYNKGVRDGKLGSENDYSSYEDNGYVTTTEDPCLKINSSRNTLSMTVTRSLRVGDTFTPQEMLPITIKLLQKVPRPGSGIGFVSSTNSSRTLADKLFGAYFQTRRRIVILKEVDISGLDALQALALSGSSTNLRDMNYYSPNKEDHVSYKIPTNYTRLKSRYNLLIKNIDGGKASKNNIRRRKVNHKKITPNKFFVGNPARRKEHEEKRKKMSKNRLRSHGASKFTCRWRYQCTNRTDQSSCHIHPDCTNNPYDTYIGAAHQETKMRSSRKKVLEPVDKEVLQILWRHVLSARPTAVNDIKFENIGQYFNRLLKNAEEGSDISNSESEADGNKADALCIPFYDDYNYGGGGFGVDYGHFFYDFGFYDYHNFYQHICPPRFPGGNSHKRPGKKRPIPKPPVKIPWKPRGSSSSSTSSESSESRSTSSESSESDSECCFCKKCKKNKCCGDCRTKKCRCNCNCRKKKYKCCDCIIDKTTNSAKEPTTSKEVTKPTTTTKPSTTKKVTKPTTTTKSRDLPRDNSNFTHTDAHACPHAHCLCGDGALALNTPAERF